MLRDVLLKLAEELNKEDITWAIAGSVLLKLKGIKVKPNDIDILVSLEDTARADRIIKNLSQKREDKSNNKDEKFATEIFCKFVVDDIGIDLMAGFALKLNNNNRIKKYEFSFGKHKIVETFKLDGVQIPLTALEDWYVLYYLMPNRENKVQLIKSYFKENKVEHPNILREYKKEDISEGLNKKIDEVLIKD